MPRPLAPRTTICPVCGVVGREGEECERCAAWEMLAYALGRPLSRPPNGPAPRSGGRRSAAIPALLGLPAAGGLYGTGNAVGAAAVVAVSILATGWLLVRRAGPRRPPN